jgi:hypothetical protein
VLIVAILGALGIWKMSNKWWASLFLGLFFIVANYWVWHDAYLSMKGRELDLHSREADIRVLRTEILAKDQQLAQHPAPRAAQFPQRNKLLSLARDLTRFAAPHSREANILGEVRKQFGGRVEVDPIFWTKKDPFLR